MSRIEVPKCINETKFHVEIREENQGCSTKYASTGEIVQQGDLYKPNITYIFKEMELNNCAYTSFNTKKLEVIFEAKKVEQPFTDFRLCEDMLSRGLMKVFMDDGSIYLSADHFWKYETTNHNFMFDISLDGKSDRNFFDRKLFDRKL